MAEMGEVLFGYRHVDGVPNCPCGDCGTYMMLEQPDPERPLAVKFRSWCGRSLKATFDSTEERTEFLARNRA